jgi:hypothetical protein
VSSLNQKVKRPLGRPRRRWKDNIKLDLREIGIDGANWIQRAQDRKWLNDGEDCKMRSFITCTHHQYYYDDLVRKDEIGGARSAHGRREMRLKFW